jgi:hypothetical protein
MKLAIHSEFIRLTLAQVYEQLFIESVDDQI